MLYLVELTELDSFSNSWEWMLEQLTLMYKQRELILEARKLERQAFV